MPPHKRQRQIILIIPKKVLDNFMSLCYYIGALRRAANAPVAQLDRVTDYESVGQGFESLLAYQKIQIPIRVSGFFVCPKEGLED